MSTKISATRTQLQKYLNQYKQEARNWNPAYSNANGNFDTYWAGISEGHVMAIPPRQLIVGQ